MNKQRLELAWIIKNTAEGDLNVVAEMVDVLGDNR